MDKVSHKSISGPLKAFYIIFLGAMLALFFGVGVAAFYESPKAPDYPVILQEQVKEETPEMTKVRAEYDTKEKAYEADFKTYNRNLSIIILILSLITLVFGLVIFSHVYLISDGLLLGAVFTLGYSILRGLMSQDVKFRFVVVAVGLVVTLFLGYIKFIKNKE